MIDWLKQTGRAYTRTSGVGRDVLTALAFTAIISLVAAVMLAAFGDTRLGMVFLLPVLFSGAVRGLRAGLIAAAVSFSIYNFFLVDPIFTLQIASAEDASTLAVFFIVAVVAGAASGALREEHARADRRARVLDLLIEANAFFSSTPSEAAVRTRLAEFISSLTGMGAAISDADGQLSHRAGPAVDWRGAIEGELSALSRDTMLRANTETLTLGRFRSRSARMNARIFGVAVWLPPQGSAAFIRESDQYVAMLIELATAAIVRCRRGSGEVVAARVIRPIG